MGGVGQAARRLWPRGLSSASRRVVAAEEAVAQRSLVLAGQLALTDGFSVYPRAEAAVAQVDGERDRRHNEYNHADHDPHTHSGTPCDLVGSSMVAACHRVRWPHRGAARLGGRPLLTIGHLGGTVP